MCLRELLPCLLLLVLFLVARSSAARGPNNAVTHDNARAYMDLRSKSTRVPPRSSSTRPAPTNEQHFSANQHHMLVFARADTNWDFQLDFDELAAFLGGKHEVPALPPGRSWPVQLHEYGRPTLAMQRFRLFERHLKAEVRDLRVNPRHGNDGLRRSFTDTTLAIGHNRVKQFAGHLSWTTPEAAARALEMLTGTSNVDEAAAKRKRKVPPLIEIPRSWHVATPVMLTDQHAAREVVSMPAARFLLDLYARTQDVHVREIVLWLLEDGRIDIASPQEQAIRRKGVHTEGTRFQSAGPRRSPLIEESLAAFVSDLELVDAILRHPQFKVVSWNSAKASTETVVDADGAVAPLPNALAISTLHFLACDISTGLTKRVLQTFDHTKLVPPEVAADAKAVWHEMQQAPNFAREDVWAQEAATPDIARVEFASLSKASARFRDIVAEWTQRSQRVCLLELFIALCIHGASISLYSHALRRLLGIPASGRSTC